jgi:hypothetical protein
MGTERFWRIHWLVAVWHNIIGGAGLVFFGNYLYEYEGLAPPQPGVHYVRWMLLIFVFGFIYYMVYKDMYNTEKLVLAGICGKVASATPDVYYLLFKGGVPWIFWGSVFTDYVFAITFFLFLGYVKQHKAEHAPVASVAGRA